MSAQYILCQTVVDKSELMQQRGRCDQMESHVRTVGKKRIQLLRPGGCDNKSETRKLMARTSQAGARR